MEPLDIRINTTKKQVNHRIRYISAALVRLVKVYSLHFPDKWHFSYAYLIPKSRYLHFPILISLNVLNSGDKLELTL